MDGEHLVGRERPGDDPFDGVEGRARSEAGGDGFGEVETGEGGRCLGEAAEEIGDPFVGGDGSVGGDDLAGLGVDERVGGQSPHLRFGVDAGARRCVGDEFRRCLRSPAGGDRLSLPAGVESFTLQFGLAATRRQRRLLGCGRRVGVAVSCEPGFDLGASLGERLEDRRRDAGDLLHVSAGRPLDAERRRELAPHGSLEDLAGGASCAVEVGMSERRPPAVVALDEVRDEDVPVEERVARPARSVPERRTDDAAGRDATWSVASGGFGVFGSQSVEPRLVVRSALCPDRFAFEPRDSLLSRRLRRLRSLHPAPVGRRRRRTARSPTSAP